VFDLGIGENRFESNLQLPNTSLPELSKSRMTLPQTKSEDYSDNALDTLMFKGYSNKNSGSLDKDFASGGKIPSGIKTP
jgi:hypothetical protein